MNGWTKIRCTYYNCWLYLYLIVTYLKCMKSKYIKIVNVSVSLVFLYYTVKSYIFCKFLFADHVLNWKITLHRISVFYEFQDYKCWMILEKSKIHKQSYDKACKVKYSKFKPIASSGLLDIILRSYDSICLIKFS